MTKGVDSGGKVEREGKRERAWARERRRERRGESQGAQGSVAEARRARERERVSESEGERGREGECSGLPPCFAVTTLHCSQVPLPPLVRGELVADKASRRLVLVRDAYPGAVFSPISRKDVVVRQYGGSLSAGTLTPPTQPRNVSQRGPVYFPVFGLLSLYLSYRYCWWYENVSYYHRRSRVNQNRSRWTGHFAD